MIKLLTSHRIFFILILGWAILGAIFLGIYGSSNLFLLLHKEWGHNADLVFRAITEMGSTTFSVIIAVVLILKDRKAGLVASLAMILSTIATHIIKFWINAPRPSVFFAQSNPIKAIEGVQLLVEHSFPSGHTTAAFALATVLTFSVTNKRLSSLFFLMAVMVGYSRIYLGQHFPADVYAGSLIAVIVCSFTWFMFYFRSQKKTGTINA